MSKPARVPRRRPAPERRGPLGWERKGFFCPPDLVHAIREMSETFANEGDFLRFIIRQEWRVFLRTKNASPTT
jgi:hypothetical protein